MKTYQHGSRSKNETPSGRTDADKGRDEGILSKT